MTPTNSSVKPKRASAGSIAPTRISACTVVSIVPVARTASAAAVESTGRVVVAFVVGRNRSRCAVKA